MTRVLACACALLVLLVPATALAAAGGITPLSPKNGGTVKAGADPTFKFRVKGSGQLWVHVCKSKKPDKTGAICSDESIGKATRGKGGVASYKPKVFDFPGFWLSTPGTYYWQALRIACVKSDCQQEGPVVRFTVA
jgi:hypothetical protein